jgi:hypothetical protein
MIVIDINPADANSLVLSGSSIELIKNSLVPYNSLVGAGHSPLNVEDGWVRDEPALVISGSSYYLDGATQYLFDERSDVYGPLFGCTGSDWATWTMFIVMQQSQIAAVETILFNVGQVIPTTFPGAGAAEMYPLFSVYSNAASFGYAIWSDTFGSSNGAVLGSVDTDAHVIEISADGAGNVQGWLDGATSGSIADVRPKTPGSMTVGGGWYTSPPYVNEQFNGNVARIFIFNENLSSSERKKVRTYLASKYGVAL